MITNEEIAKILEYFWDKQAEINLKSREACTYFAIVGSLTLQNSANDSIHRFFVYDGALQKMVKCTAEELQESREILQKHNLITFIPVNKYGTEYSLIMPE